VAATNFAWAAVDLWHGIWAQAALQAVLLCSGALGAGSVAGPKIIGMSVLALYCIYSVISVATVYKLAAAANQAKARCLNFIG
jgi:hypothetical protein